MDNFDFFKVSARNGPKGVVEIYPKFFMTKSSDLMIKGGDFYAIWVEERGLWSTDEQDLIRLIDRELDRYAEEYKNDYKEKYGEEKIVRPLYLRDVENGMINRWRTYCQKQLRDNFVMLDNKLVFSNDKVVKTDYASKRLPYPLQDGKHDAYDQLMSVLYSPEELRKLEWAIGAVVSGDSVNIQKFVVLYGAAGTGKSTVLNIMEQLFEGYYTVFDSKALGSSNNSFALEAFKANPLVALEHDGDFSRIEDNTRINSLVSHELMTVNEKFRSVYATKFRSFLFMGTNKPVRITDAKSGLIRRLIDISPSGNKVPLGDYRRLVKQISFELGAIAKHCLDVYREDPGYYDNYIPIGMMSASNDFYNFVENVYFTFKESDGTSLRDAWNLYRSYCEDAKVAYPYSMRVFKEELKNYFLEYTDRYTASDGSRIRSFYSGFRTDKFEQEAPAPAEKTEKTYSIAFMEQPSLIDEVCGDCLAQYASNDGVPTQSWDNVKTTLSQLDTSRVHYVLLPENHIVIDFDLKDENGKKSPSKNLEEASKWPPTYAELSKSGAGIHLHYIYTGGDPKKLKRLYSKDVEIKVFTGKSSLRRKLTKCNSLPIANISSGLPLKGEAKTMLYPTTIKNAQYVRRRIANNLRKAEVDSTAQSVSMIKKILDDAYESGISYDVSDMINAISLFAAQSDQKQRCTRMVAQMKFKSKDAAEPQPDSETGDVPIVIFDVEVKPNLFLVCWKFRGKNHPVVRMFNPKKEDIDKLFYYRLVGFNNKNYDNDMLWARHLGWSEADIFDLSQRKIVKKDRTASFKEARNISWADCFDFASKKQSLKKYEIELAKDNPELRHLEFDSPWDEPISEDRWDELADYCANDVISTEAVFEYLAPDFAARKILAELAGGIVNDSTNQLSAKFIFEGNRNPQWQFNYRNLGAIPDKVCRSKADAEKGVIFNNFGDEYTLFDLEGRPVFPGYTYDRVNRVSTYRGETVSEGGYVYAEPGIYYNVVVLDIASMHPSSAIAEKVFGDYYTERFRQIVEARLAIKHRDIARAKTLLNGVLAPYLNDEALLEGLAKALKIVINSVYGESYSRHPNPFRDDRNIDNIIAKRGALFMINLKHEVQAKGYTVAHIKTDSIKIPNATPEIIKFVQEYGEQYGYSFEHESTYDRMCLVNDAVYVAKYDTAERTKEHYGYIPGHNAKHGGEWTATGTQFQVPFVFKSLFSKEPIIFDDYCETRTVTTSMFLDMNEQLPDGEHCYKFVGRTGQFTPIKPGCYGGLLLRKTEGPDGEVKYSAVTGTKGYRWLESVYVRQAGREADIDTSYHEKLAEDAMAAISKYGDFEIFITDDPYPWIDPNEIPFDI